MVNIGKAIGYVVMAPLILTLWLILGVVFIPLIIILLPLNLIGELLNKVLNDTSFNY